MGGIRRFVVAFALAASVNAGAARADDPLGLSALVPSFARLEIGAVASDHAAFAPPLTGRDNATLAARTPSRAGAALTLRYRLAPWWSLDFAHGLLRAQDDADGNPLYVATRVFDQAGTTLYPARGWNASLFVNFFRMDAATDDLGVKSASVSFVNARLNHEVSSHVHLSFDVLNVFDKRMNDVDPHIASRLWTEPLIAENVLFDASESRGFRVRLAIGFR
jgi:hypothetical protein